MQGYQKRERRTAPCRTSKLLYGLEDHHPLRRTRWAPINEVPLSLEAYQWCASGGGVERITEIYKSKFVYSRAAIRRLHNSLCEETYCIQGASGLLISKLAWVVGLFQEGLNLNKNEFTAKLESSFVSGNWTTFAWCMNRWLLLRQWRDVDTSIR